MSYSDGSRIQCSYDPAGNRTQKVVTVASTVDAYEPDDTRDQAAPLVPEATQSHNLISDGDANQDWVSFRLAEETHLVIGALALGVDPSSGSPPGARFDYSDCAASGLPAGDYAVNVSGYLSGTAPGYDITLHVMACDGSNRHRCRWRAGQQRQLPVRTQSQPG